MNSPKRLGETANVDRKPERQPDNRRLMPCDSSFEAVGGHALAEVEDIESRALQDVGGHPQPRV